MKNDVKILFTFMENWAELGGTHRWLVVPGSVRTEWEKQNETGGSGAGTLVPTLVQAAHSPHLTVLVLVPARHQQKQKAGVILITKLYLVNALD